MSILIKNARIIDPSQKMDKKGDVLVKDSIIVKTASVIKEKADVEIDAKNKIVSPGFIDMHTHLREPGREDKETVETGLAAAIAGGFTTVCAMPNTTPACDSQAHVKFLYQRADETGLANILPIGSITKGREGSAMSEMGELKEAGAPAVSEDGSSVMNAGLMRRAMEYAAMLDLLVISHCEEESLSAGGVMYEGYWSTVLGLAPVPAEAESIIVERDVRLAELTGARLHIAHVSTAQSVEIIKNAKKRGVKVTAEVTPHHFSLTDEALKTFDTNLKVNPPLASEKDVKALKKGLKDGTIDVIATDHAPHMVNEKEMEFNFAPFGMIGLETALSLAVENLLDAGVLDWPELIAKFTSIPAGILKYKRGSLKEGSIADITVIDPEKEWVYEKKNIRSKSSNSPFIGKKMKGKVTGVIVGGKLVFANEDMV